MRPPGWLDSGPPGGRPSEVQIGRSFRLAACRLVARAGEKPLLQKTNHRARRAEEVQNAGPVVAVSCGGLRHRFMDSRCSRRRSPRCPSDKARQCPVLDRKRRGSWFYREARNIGSARLRAHLVVRWGRSDDTLVAASSVYLTRGLFGPLLVPNEVVRFGTSAYGYTRPSDIDHDATESCKYEIFDAQGTPIRFVET